METVEKVTSQLQTIEYLRLQIEDKNIIFLVAKDQDRIIGVITARLENGTVQGTRLYVHANYRNKGIGERLMLEVQAKNPSIKCARITVKKDNQRALAFYLKLGFQIVGEESQVFFNETAMNYILEMRLKAAL